MWYGNHVRKTLASLLYIPLKCTLCPPSRSLFVRYGNVIDVVIVDDYGFVNMATIEGAEMAIQARTDFNDGEGC